MDERTGHGAHRQAETGAAHVMEMTRSGAPHAPPPTIRLEMIDDTLRMTDDGPGLGPEVIERFRRIGRHDET